MKKWVWFLPLVLSGCSTTQTFSVADALSLVTFGLDLLKRFGVLAMIAVALVLGGCNTGQIKPESRFKIDPKSGRAEWSSSRDDNMTLGKAKAQWGDNRSLEIDNLTVCNQSSPVIRENVEQMRVRVEQIRAEGQAVREALTGLAAVVDEIGNIINVPKGVIDKIADLRVRVDAMNRTFETGPATQPADK